MSFLDHYVAKYRLDKMPEKHKENIEKIEKKLEQITKQAKGKLTFDDLLKQFGPQIADLVERVSKYIGEIKNWSFSTIIGVFRFVNSIATEVHQIVEQMAGCVVDDTMTEQEKHSAKVSFGKELVYFIWKTVDPLRGRLSWIPFKQTIEKKLVMWLAGMALESTVDLFAASGLTQMSAMGWPGDSTKSTIMKALL